MHCSLLHVFSKTRVYFLNKMFFAVYKILRSRHPCLGEELKSTKDRVSQGALPRNRRQEDSPVVVGSVQLEVVPEINHRVDQGMSMRTVGLKIS